MPRSVHARHLCHLHQSAVLLILLTFMVVVDGGLVRLNDGHDNERQAVWSSSKVGRGNVASQCWSRKNANGRSANTCILDTALFHHDEACSSSRAACDARYTSTFIRHVVNSTAQCGNVTEAKATCQSRGCPQQSNAVCDQSEKPFRCVCPPGRCSSDGITCQSAHASEVQGGPTCPKITKSTTCIFSGCSGKGAACKSRRCYCPDGTCSYDGSNCEASSLLLNAGGKVNKAIGNENKSSHHLLALGLVVALAGIGIVFTAKIARKQRSTQPSSQVQVRDGFNTSL